MCKHCRNYEIDNVVDTMNDLRNSEYWRFYLSNSIFIVWLIKLNRDCCLVLDREWRDIESTKEEGIQRWKVRGILPFALGKNRRRKQWIFCSKEGNLGRLVVLGNIHLYLMDAREELGRLHQQISQHQKSLRQHHSQCQHQKVDRNTSKVVWSLSIIPVWIVLIA